MSKVPPQRPSRQAGHRSAQHTQHSGQQPGHQAVGGGEAAKTLAQRISDFLFRWRRLILISLVVIVVAVIAIGVLAALRQRQQQAAALAIYQLRQGFERWQEAHPQDVLAAQKTLAAQDEEALELDEESQQEAEQTEQALTELLQKNIGSKQKERQAWGYWIQARKAEHLDDEAQLQQALEQLLALQDGPGSAFYSLAKLHLATLLYTQDKVEQAVAHWQELADITGPAPEQIVAGIYLGNYFARQGQKEEAIGYWKLVQSLGTELLQANGLEDEDSFLGGDNLIAGNFRSTLKQWQAMAQNQLLFLQSELTVPANSYDASAPPINTEDAEGTQQPSLSADGTTYSFTTPPAGTGFGLPGGASLDLSDLNLQGGEKDQ